MPLHAALGVLGTLGFLALWQAANAWTLVDPVLLPAPEVVFRALARNWAEPTFAQSAYATQLVATVYRMLLGLTLATGAGVLLALY
jgi:ABC-type nitrate/sulfonate/bicarbonate transport system permease component